MITEEPSLAEAIQHGIDTALDHVFKAGPGIVKSYDPLTNTAFIQPALKHAVWSVSTDERTFLEVGEIPFVPVVFPRAGGFVLRTPVSPGDHVLLVYCDSSLAEYRENGQVSEPQDARRHSIGWPVAIVGFFPDNKALSPLDAAAVALGAAIFGEDGGKQMRVGPLGIELSTAGVTPISPVALANASDNALTTLTNALNSLISTVNALITNYNSHQHAVSGAVASSIASLATAADAGPDAPETTASTLVKSL